MYNKELLHGLVNLIPIVCPHHGAGVGHHHLFGANLVGAISRRHKRCCQNGCNRRWTPTSNIWWDIPTSPKEGSPIVFSTRDGRRNLIPSPPVLQVKGDELSCMLTYPQALCLECYHAIESSHYLLKRTKENEIDDLPIARHLGFDKVRHEESISSITIKGHYVQW